jgi:hypothetical protein
MPDFPFQDLRGDIPIVNPDGTPSDYFLQMMFRLSQNAEQDSGDIQSKLDKTTPLNTATGLLGGGPLGAPLTLYLDADLNDLNDVDTATTPPTDGQVLTYDSGPGLWVPETPSGGGGGGSAVLLQTQTVVGAANVNFDNTKITATYKHYLLRWTNVSASVNGQLLCRLSPDNGTTIRTTNYQTGYTNWGLTTNFSQYVPTPPSGMMITAGVNTDTVMPSNGEMTIYNLLNAAVRKSSISRGIAKAADNNVYDNLAGTIYNVAEAINYLRILNPSGNISGTFQLYGLL